MVNYAHLIPVFPFLAFLINICVGRKLKVASALISIMASTISLILSIFVYLGLQKGEGSYVLGTWLTLNGVPLNFGINIDALTVMMLLVVTIVGTLIQVYSIGYMHGDPRFSRFFAYLSLFMASMLGLVLADNFLMLYIFWEGVGLCSYLLIAFWFERPAAAKAGLKAFVTTRIGDTGLLIGIFLLYFTSHTFQFSQLSQLTGNETLLTIAALLIFLGAVGKSAQFPLHVWLPDAMEGPTAVSALIHAATMVAAGVYLVARTYALFMISPFCLEVVAVIGAISALLAASIATVNNDIKRVLAYSTISQLGLMMVGLGVGGYSAGTFHLMTHAFFKALLFLCAGSIIHGVHTQDIQKMGGLFSKMKITGVAFAIGTLAIAGVPPFAGFWSKDEILTEIFNGGHPVLFAMAVLTSFLTAFYMARLIFLVLFGKSRSDLHAHESPITMTSVLVILSVFAAGVGLLGSPIFKNAFQNYVFFKVETGVDEIHTSYVMMAVSTFLSFAGISLAYLMYIRGLKILPSQIRVRFTWLYKLAVNKFYFDELYEAIFIRPCLCFGRVMGQFDFKIVDGLVNGVAKVTEWVSQILRRLQTGVVQNYMLIQVMGALILILTVIQKLCFRF